MPKNPFDFDDGFENIPVVSATTQAVKKATDAAGKATTKQASNTTKAFVNQLYAKSDQTADDQQVDVADPGVQAQTHNKPTMTPTSATPHAAKVAHAGQAATAAQHPQTEDEAKLEETRKKLQQQHTTEYFNPTIGDLETQMKRDEQQMKQAEQMEAQQEEQEKKQEMSELEEQKKKEVPMAVKMGQNRAESHRGVSG